MGDSIDLTTARQQIPWLEVDEIDGCWRWTRAHNAYGYGVKRLDAKVRSVHRTVWTLLVGPIPEGLTIDHLCRIRDCCNPAHLEPVPMGVNRARAQPYCKDNHVCRNGHLRTPENTRWAADRKGNKTKVCKDCRAASNKRYTANPEAFAKKADYQRRYLAAKRKATP